MQTQVFIPYFLGHNIWVQIISNKFAGIGFKNPPLKENILTYSQEDTVYETEMKNIFVVRPTELQILFEKVY